MITEDYVSFEVAKLLKEKGFDIRSEYYYYYTDKDGNTTPIQRSSGRNYENYNSWFDSVIKTTSAPTQTLACKWLREKHELSIEFYTQAMAYASQVVYKGYVNKYYQDGFKKPEEAIEAALLYSLQNLVK